MLKIIVLIPLILSVLWFGYLKANNYSVADGKQGFKYILVISSVIAVFFTFMYFVTKYRSRGAWNGFAELKIDCAVTPLRVFSLATS